MCRWTRPTQAATTTRWWSSCEASSETFKTNPDLFFAVVTGYLRISKESIFTGINNLKVNTITDTRYDEYFGFMENNVRKLLADYDMEYALVKQFIDMADAMTRGEIEQLVVGRTIRKKIVETMTITRTFIYRGEALP